MKRHTYLLFDLETDTPIFQTTGLEKRKLKLVHEVEEVKEE